MTSEVGSNSLNTVATLGGKHIQARTGRELTYWCAYEFVGETDLSYVAVVNEGRNDLGQHEANLHDDPYGIPARALVRINLLKYLDRAAFGGGEPPDPRWIGWYGPYL